MNINFFKKELKRFITANNNIEKDVIGIIKVGKI